MQRAASLLPLYFNGTCKVLTNVHRGRRHAGVVGSESCIIVTSHGDRRGGCGSLHYFGLTNHMVSTNWIESLHSARAHYTSAYGVQVARGCDFQRHRHSCTTLPLDEERQSNSAS